MRSRYKILFSSFFLLIFTFNVIIYYSVFEFSDLQAKADMAQMIGSLKSLEQTEQVKLPLSRLEDTRHDEIWLSGRLFDIVKTEVKGDSVVVYILNDSREQALIAGLKSHEEEGTDKTCRAATGKPVTRHIHKLPSQKYLPEAAIFSFRCHPGTNVVSCVMNYFYLAPVQKVAAVPPEPIS